jgi:8-oxo-dGTP pyrophosphatase MutT (NUDIX family)
VSTAQENRLHLTVATLIEDQGRFLLVEELIDGEILLNQPAGHVDPPESPLAAAVREVKEETGYTVHLTGFLGASTYRASATDTFYRLTFTGSLASATPVAPSDPDILRAIWLTAEQIRARRNHRSPLVWRDIERYLSAPALSLALFSDLESGNLQQ